MKILLFGATGMVGDGVLRWVIACPQVERVVAVSRKPLSVPLSIPKTQSRQTRDLAGEVILPFGYLLRTRVTRLWPSVPKGRDRIRLASRCYASAGRRH